MGPDILRQMRAGARLITFLQIRRRQAQVVARQAGIRRQALLVEANGLLGLAAAHGRLPLLPELLRLGTGFGRLLRNWQERMTTQQQDAEQSPKMPPKHGATSPGKDGTRDIAVPLVIARENATDSMKVTE